MIYLVLDPGHEYPAAMIEFLGSRGHGAIAVFTNDYQLAAYRHLFADRLESYLVDSYLLSDWDDARALIGTILGRWGNWLEGIIPWDETTIETGAVLGEWLGLDWNSHDVIRGFRDKFTMKSRLRAYGDIRVNASSVVRSAGDVSDFLGRISQWPVVIKPSHGSGTRGVTFAWSWDDLLEACQNLADSGGGDVILEEYVGGKEFVVNGIVDADSDLLVTDIWVYDKISLDGARDIYYDTHKVSTGNQVFWPLADYAGKVVERLGLRRAPIHLEVKVDESGPCLIEVGARLGGGRLPTLASELHGRSLFELAACHYLADIPVRIDDLNYELYDQGDARVVTGVQYETLGRVSEIHGLDIVQSLPSFHSLDHIRPVGSFLPRTTDMFTRNYEVYLVHPDADQVSYDAQVVRKVLQYS